MIDLWFHHVRRTAVVGFARLGATVPEISTVVGHALDNATQILK